MKVVNRIDPRFLYGITSFICSVSTVVIVSVLLLRAANQPEPEPGLFDLPPHELVQFIFICPLIHLCGLLLGVASFGLQPNTNGIGLWAMIVSLLFLLFDFFVWFKWTS
ncbi:MAG: hypothetical protein JNK38_27880 [Acidobacteria bacterium]|nr:hypothetical protein [Acidobacteriota bacterium]